jgi:transcriptional regulator with XRE-family HTH domain
MTTKKSKGSLDIEWIAKSLGGPITLGMALEALRGLYEHSQVTFAKKLGVSRAYLCDIEKGRRLVGPGKAAQFAKIIGHPPEYFVQLALDDLLRSEGLKMKTQVESAA